MSKQGDDRTIDAYFAEVRTSVLLTAEQERALFLQYRTCTRCRASFSLGKHQPVCGECGAKRDFGPRDRLVKGALRFVIKVAKEYARQARGVHHTAEDLKVLISAGNLGLLIAVDRFNTTMGTRFLTYAAYWIKEKIREELDSSGLVHVPTYKQKELRLRRRQGEDIEFDAAVVQLENIDALDTTHSEEEVERNFLNTYGAEAVHNALTELGFRGRERYILIAYFGVREEPKNLRQISNRLELSSERVRQIKQDVLTQLRTHLEAKQVNDSVDLFTE